jgi:pimeloyl-ACP methyl ester carboxylesterase
MSARRSLLPFCLGTLFFFGCLLFAAVAADPFGATRVAGEALLSVAGARVELFRGGDGTRLRVLALGPPSAERPVVLLHGLGADATYWTFTARALMKRGRTVYLLDGPGSGGSDAPAAPAGYGLAARVAGVDAMAQALGLDTFDLVGHSLGGWTAARYALEKPHRITRLVLVDSGGLGEVLPADADAEKRRLVPSGRAEARRLWDLLFFRKPVPAAGFVLDAVGRNYGSGCAAATIEALREEDFLADRIRRLPRGSVLIWGERETLFPIGQARLAAARIPGSRLLVLTGVGHDGPIEAPKVFRRALFDALGMLPDG